MTTSRGRIVPAPPLPTLDARLHRRVDVPRQTARLTESKVLKKTGTVTLEYAAEA